MNDLCAVFICNKNYFNKFLLTCKQLISNGNYKGDICLVIGDDLKNDNILNCELIIKNNIIIKHFSDIQFTKDFLDINNNIIISNDKRHITKKFQWHKLYLFNSFFKKWKYIFYLDCGMTIFSDILPILNEAEENTLLAHSDAYPKYEWKLHTQFEKNNKYFIFLNKIYNLDIDYFQTTMMLYDTNIIEETTYDELYKLMLTFPISKTNEQGIIALYFTNIKPIFKQIKLQNENIYFYDYLSRNLNNKYIMLKSLD